MLNFLHITGCTRAYRWYLSFCSRLNGRRLHLFIRMNGTPCFYYISLKIILEIRECDGPSKIHVSATASRPWRCTSKKHSARFWKYLGLPSTFLELSLYALTRTPNCLLPKKNIFFFIRLPLTILINYADQFGYLLLVHFLSSIRRFWHAGGPAQPGAWQRSAAPDTVACSS